MGYVREGHSQPPEELVDSWLLQLFPGRTLDELDMMDWGRLWRALSARQVEHVEKRRIDFLAGTVKELTKDEWDQIRAHEELVGDGQE